MGDGAGGAQVAAVHEELGGVREDARGLRQSVDAALGGMREQVVAVVAELSEVRGHSAEVGRLAGDVDAVRAAVKEEARQAAVSGTRGRLVWQRRDADGGAHDLCTRFAGVRDPGCPERRGIVRRWPAAAAVGRGVAQVRSRIPVRGTLCAN